MATGPGKISSVFKARLSEVYEAEQGDPGTCLE